MVPRSALRAAALVVVILATLTQSALLPGDFPPPRPVPVSAICAAVLCIRGTQCRVVMECAGPKCRPQPTCIPCVDEGVDDLCNANRYLYALLAGQASQPNSLKAFQRRCEPAQPNNQPNCPMGSVCVADGSSGQGNCCYGKPDPAPPVGTPVSNGMTICSSSDNCGGCKADEVCKEIQIVCITTPCDPIYECRPKVKDGTCPVLPAFVPDDCPRDPPQDCQDDSDCSGDLKCCSTQCGGLACTVAFS